MPQPDKYSIVAVSGSVQGLDGESVNEIATRVLDNDEFTLQRIEDFLNDREQPVISMQSQDNVETCDRTRRLEAVLDDFDTVFAGLDAKI